MINLACAGLYHKLHGIQRPGAMKKTIIKRRKRVVAPQNGSINSVKQTAAPTTAAPDATPTPNQAAALHQLAQHISNVVAASDEDTDMGDSASTAGGASQQDASSNGPSSNFNPRYLPIDFTSRSQSTQMPASTGGAPLAPMMGSSAYHSDDATLAPLQLYQSQQSGSSNQPSPRKRSLSVSSAGDNVDDMSTSTHRLHSINSILNPHSSSSNTDIPIEPSLLVLGRFPNEEQQRVYALREKRLRLEREQKRLREEIDAVDKELAAVVPMQASASAEAGSSNSLSDTARNMIVRALQQGSTSLDPALAEGGVGDGGGGGKNGGNAAGRGEDPMILT